MPREVLGLVPARGGSKSVPRKNIRPLAGEPLIAYTIREALKSRHITRLIVSTEDEEIARVAAQYGAQVPFLRPVELAADSTTDLPVFQHALRWLREREGYSPEVLVHLRPTAPLRLARHIDEAVELLLGHPEADCVRSVCPAGQHPLKMWKVEDGLLHPYIPESVYGIPEAYNQPRQRLPRAFVQNGAVDVIRARTILEMGSMTGKVIGAFLMDEMESVNIDSPLDFELGQLIMMRRKAALSQTQSGGA